MTKERIIQRWRSGLNKFSVAKEYMQEHNKDARRRKEPTITKEQALAHVEPILYEYETKDWK